MAWEGSGRWPMYLGPAIHVEDLDGVPGFWLGPGLDLAVIAIWGLNQHIKYLSFSAFQVNK